MQQVTLQVNLSMGQLLLLTKNYRVVCIAPKTATYEKMLSNIEEVKARGGRLIMIANEGDEHAKELADHVIYVPATIDELSPLVSVIPLQIMSYYIALQLGCDVDQPRNLAKSVTVSKLQHLLLNCLKLIQVMV